MSFLITSCLLPAKLRFFFDIRKKKPKISCTYAFFFVPLHPQQILNNDTIHMKRLLLILFIALGITLPFHAQTDSSLVVFTVNDVSFTMVFVEGGTFMMGATPEQGSDADEDEMPAHEVTLSDFYIGQTEVTQGLWEAVMETDIRRQRDKAGPAWTLRGKGANYPMYFINWDECQTFVEKLNALLAEQLGGKHFALPTEAQWEYAARGGKKSEGYKCSGSNTAEEVAWHSENSSSYTFQVARKAPNELGLYDMSGNVYEWCQDRFGNYSAEAQTDPTGAPRGADRVLRGGGWGSRPSFCRVSARNNNSPTYRGDYLGLRLVCQ